MEKKLKIEVDFKSLYTYIRDMKDTSSDYFWNGGHTLYFSARFFNYRGTHWECEADWTYSAYPCELRGPHITVPAKKGEEVTFPENIESIIVKAIYSGINYFHPEYKGFQFEIVKV